MLFSWGKIKEHKIAFEDICPAEDRTIRERARRSFNVSVEPENPLTGQDITLKVLDESSEGISNAGIEAYTGRPGYSKSMYSGEADRNGILTFNLEEAGTYNIRVNAPGYHPPQKTLELVVERIKTTTTAPASTTSTTSPTTSPSTTRGVTTSTTTTTSTVATSPPTSFAPPTPTTITQKMTGQVTRMDGVAITVSMVLFVGLSGLILGKKYIGK